MNLLVCHCQYRSFLSDEMRAFLATLPGSHVADLCAVSRDRAAELAELETADLLVLACRPRAVRSLLASAGVKIAEEQVLDVRELTVGQLKEKVGSGTEATTVPESVDDAWNPVLDRELCINCGRCLDFCLFNVYKRDEQNRVVVARPKQCKDNCPACSGVCPVAAVIFPKCPDDRVNGASKERPESLPEDVAKIKERLLARRKKRRMLRPGALGAKDESK